MMINSHLKIYTYITIQQQQQIIIKVDFAMNESDSFLTTISENQKNTDLTKPKFISATKWQMSMIDQLKHMINKYKQKKNLITDLITIVSSVPEVSFVQATLKIRPFKPQFFQSVTILCSTTQETVAETINKNIRFSPCKIKNHQEIKKKQKTTQKTLIKQFDKDYHPYKFIIKNFKRLLQLKYKSLMDSNKILSVQQLSSQLKSDMTIFSQFIHKVSQPYKRLFKSSSFSNNQQKDDQKFQQFIDTFIQDNDKLNGCICKILSYGCSKFHRQQVQKNILDQSQPSDFNLAEQFKIDGGYIRTISSLMQFAELSNPQSLMRKLFRVRQNILVDISSYYDEKNSKKQLQVCAEVQIQILRFCIAKLKGWAVQIYAKLKFLQFVNGQDEMGYKFEQSSVIYTQISMVFQILMSQPQLIQKLQQVQKI